MYIAQKSDNFSMKSSQVSAAAHPAALLVLLGVLGREGTLGSPRYGLRPRGRPACQNQERRFADALINLSCVIQEIKNLKCNMVLHLDALAYLLLFGGFGVLAHEALAISWKPSCS